MYRVYEIFEVSPNGSPQRVTVVSGLEAAKSRLHQLANNTSNECFAMDARTRQIVALMNVPPATWRAMKHIFQVSYDEESGRRRAELLKSRGYAVISVIGNEAAKLLLSSIQPYDLFIVGSAAPEQTRGEMVDWLRAQYPGVKIVALNPPDQLVLLADYNVPHEDAENWLSIVSEELSSSSAGRPGSIKASTISA